MIVILWQMSTLLLMLLYLLPFFHQLPLCIALFPFSKFSAPLSHFLYCGMRFNLYVRPHKICNRGFPKHKFCAILKDYRSSQMLVPGWASYHFSESFSVIGFLCEECNEKYYSLEIESSYDEFSTTYRSIWHCNRIIFSQYLLS